MTPKEIIEQNLSTQGQTGANISTLMDNAMFWLEQGRIKEASKVLSFARQFGLNAVNSLPITQFRK